MIIVGIMGGIGHGKTTFAESLRAAEPKSKHLENSDLIAEVVNAWQANLSSVPNPAETDEIAQFISSIPAAFAKVTVQRVVNNTFSLDQKDAEDHPELYEKLFVYINELQQKPSMLSTPITVQNKSDYRAILQWLGGYVQVKLEPGSWFRELIHRVKKLGSDGIELAILGGVRYPADVTVIKDSGGSVLLIDRALTRELDTNDPTEQARKLITPDSTIHNNAGINDLTACARIVYDDLRSNSLKQQYFAAESDIISLQNLDKNT